MICLLVEVTLQMWSAGNIHSEITIKPSVEFTAQPTTVDIRPFQAQLGKASIQSSLETCVSVHTMKDVGAMKAP